MLEATGGQPGDRDVYVREFLVMREGIAKVGQDYQCQPLGFGPARQWEP